MDELLEAFEQADLFGTVDVEDGCTVEPDGHCEHGFWSPLVLAGCI